MPGARHVAPRGCSDSTTISAGEEPCRAAPAAALLCLLWGRVWCFWVVLLRGQALPPVGLPREKAGLGSPLPMARGGGFSFLFPWDLEKSIKRWSCGSTQGTSLVLNKSINRSQTVLHLRLVAGTRSHLMVLEDLL